MRPRKSLIARKPVSQESVSRLAARLEKSNQRLSSREFLASKKAKSGVRVKV